MNSTMRKAQNLLQRVPGVLLLLPLFTPGLAPAQQVGQNGVAIWELSRPRMNAMLTLVPRDDEARYDRLRQDFIGFGCTGNSLREQAVDRKGHHKNLLCSLPGSNQQEIIVAAWISPPKKLRQRRIRRLGGSCHAPDSLQLTLS